MSDPTKDNQRENTRLRESNLVKELVESRQAHLKTQETLWGMYDVMGELLFLLQVNSDSEEGYNVAWKFLQKLEESNHEAAVALSNVVLGWVRECAVSKNQEDVLRTVDILIDLVNKKPPVTTLRVQ